MSINYQNKELQILLNGINNHLTSKNQSQKTKRMELLAAEAILKKQLKSLHNLQKQQMQRTIFLCIFSIVLCISLFFLGIYFYS